MNLNKLLLKYDQIIKNLFIVSLVTFLFIIHTQGISLADEGYIVQAGWRIASGELPFKDFFIAYTPLSAFASAFSFILLGESIVSARLLAFVVSLASCYYFFKLSKEIVKNELYAYSSLLVFIVWGPLHTNFSWPVIYTTFFSILACYFLLLSIRTKLAKYFLLTGIFASCVFLSKQNFGVAIFISILAPFISNKKLVSVKYTYLIIIGLFIPIFVFILYIHINNLWPYFVENYYYYFYKKLIIDGNGATSFIVHTTLLKDIIKVAFYTSPLIISIIALYYTYKNKREYIFIPVFTSLYYLSGIRPVTDLVHLSPLIGVSALSIGIILKEIPNSRVKILLLILVAVTVATGFYSAIFRGYYRWESPILDHYTLTDNRRINTKVDIKHANLLNDFERYVELNTGSDDYVFVFHYIPSLNFILDRENPTRFIYLHPNVLDSKYQYEIVDDLVSKKVKLVITEQALLNDKSFLTKYIKKSYTIDKNMHGYIFWLKK